MLSLFLFNNECNNFKTINHSQDLEEMRKEIEIGSDESIEFFSLERHDYSCLDELHQLLK